MNLLPTFIHARKRQDDSAPQTEAAADTRDAAPDENVSNLLPPKSPESAERQPAPQGRNRHSVDMTDLSRLSIDSYGRLYWDGKPVEVHRRILMSQTQVVGASIVTAFVVIGAIGACCKARSQRATGPAGWAGPRTIAPSPARRRGGPTFRPDFRFNFQTAKFPSAKRHRSRGAYAPER